MRIAVVGVGSIGGLLAGGLARAGEDVSVVARGAHLEAIRAHGLRLIDAGGEFAARVNASARLADLGPQDYIVLGVKAHQVADVVEDVAAALGPETFVLSAQNGVPWWYFHGAGGPHEGRPLASVDPRGRIAAALPFDRIVGGVIYAAAEIAAPGIIRHSGGNGLALGELDGATTPRITTLSQALARAGFKAPVSSDIRTEIWMKLWGNAAFNPASALTGAPLDRMCRHPLSRALMVELMSEIRAVGEALGVRFGLSIDKRIAGAEGVGAHKTSMLQDVEAGRATEIEALVGAVIEMAGMTQVPVPRLETLYALVRLKTDAL